MHAQLITPRTTVRFWRDGRVLQGDVARVFKNGRLQVRVWIPDGPMFRKPVLYRVNPAEATIV